MAIRADLPIGIVCSFNITVAADSDYLTIFLIKSTVGNDLAFLAINNFCDKILTPD